MGKGFVVEGELERRCKICWFWWFGINFKVMLRLQNRLKRFKYLQMVSSCALKLISMIKTESGLTFDFEEKLEPF